MKKLQRRGRRRRLEPFQSQRGQKAPTNTGRRMVGAFSWPGRTGEQKAPTVRPRPTVGALGVIDDAKSSNQRRGKNGWSFCSPRTTAQRSEQSRFEPPL